jgi:hypothetical protein
LAYKTSICFELFYVNFALQTFFHYFLKETQLRRRYGTASTDTRTITKTTRRSRHFKAVTAPSGIRQATFRKVAAERRRRLVEIVFKTWKAIAFFFYFFFLLLLWIFSVVLGLPVVSRYFRVWWLMISPHLEKYHVTQLVALFLKVTSCVLRFYMEKLWILRVLRDFR